MKNLLIPVLALSSLGFSADAQQKKEEKKENKKEIIINKEEDHYPHGMNLTADQQKKMDEINGRTRKETVVLHNEIAEKRAHLKTLMSMDKPDVNDVNKTIDEMQSLKSEVLKKEYAAKIERRGILTEEQRAMMPEMDFMGDGMPGQHFMFDMDNGDGNMMFIRTNEDGKESHKMIKKKIRVECDDEGDDD